MIISVDGKNLSWRESITVADLLNDLENQYPYVVIRVNNKYIDS
jgi:sulfur carrier protein ThiS